MNKVKEFRLKQGMRQSQLAKEIGVSACFISQIEAGSRKPSIEKAKKIGKILGFKWELLFESTPQDSSG